MYELIQISEHDYYIDCPAKIGLSKISEDEVVLIDSGNNKDAAKKVLKHIEANGWKLVAVYNTHSHADHIGGNRLLQDRTGCAVYARGIESAFTNFPELEPMNLYGAKPMKELRNKFLMAQDSDALLLTEEVLPEGWELIELPGHCYDMVGFRTSDNNMYVGDCVSSAETLEKYGLGYLYDPALYIETLKKVRDFEADNFIPAHAAVTKDMKELADINIESVSRAFEAILDICRTPSTFESILKQIFDRYGMEMSMQQYALIGSTVRSYLTNLLEEEKISYNFENNQMLWAVVQ